MADIVMPRLSDTMEEGTILRWLKRDGDTVARGEELVEIETDKANMIYESDLDGVLELIAAEGDTLAVGAVIAHVGTRAAADGTAILERTGGDTREGARDRAAVDGGGSSDAATAPASTAGAGADPGPAPGRGERVRASPLARRIARESGVDLSGVRGSGPGGRIVRADVLAGSGAARTAERAAGQGTPAPTAASAEGAATAKGRTTIVELSRTQQTVARRMAESRATIPDFTLEVEVDMEACIELRSELGRLARPERTGGAEDRDGPPQAPTYNDMVVKASALALREHPWANGSYRDGKVQLHERVNVGIAVASEGALVVATVFDADEKSLGEISRETRTLAERVRSGAITPPELGGGTFTVSNLGMFGVRRFSAIVNPPQAAILSVGALEPRPVVREGGLVVRHTMSLTLACDHRILYGAEAARFAARIRELLQAPAALAM